MLEATENPLIEIITLADILEISGFIGNFDVKIKKNPRYISDTKCNGCGACFDICPVYAPKEFDVGLGARKAIYRPFDQAVPNIAIIDMNRCIKCRLCITKCDLKAIEFDQKPEIKEIKVGNIIIATGFTTFKPINQFGYGKYENVITQVELERLLAPNGPTRGEVVCASDLKEPHNIVMIQCVGSRNIKENLHCSAGVCCMVAIKNATLLMEHIKGSQVTICFMDIRSVGKGHEEYFLQARKAGVKFLRGNIANVKEDPNTKNLLIRVEDTLTQEILDLKADLLVLSTAMEPEPSTEELIRMIRLDKSGDGFLKEFHVCLNPIDTKIPGIYLCGVAQGPKSIAQAVISGRAAASSAAIPMIKKVHEIVKLEAIIDPERCSQCGLCINICPYYAIKMEYDTAKVDTILCRGCGMCASVCPSGAATLRLYRDSMLENYIDALFSESQPLQ
jgi:heterodisulfide reductase subunit A